VKPGQKRVGKSMEDMYTTSSEGYRRAGRHGSGSRIGCGAADKPQLR